MRSHLFGTLALLAFALPRDSIAATQWTAPRATAVAAARLTAKKVYANAGLTVPASKMDVASIQLAVGGGPDFLVTARGVSGATNASAIVHVRPWGNKFRGNLSTSRYTGRE